MGLLTVETINTHQGAILDCYKVGGEHKKFRPPFQPYFYSLRPDRRGQPCKRILLSTLQPRTVWEVKFSRTDDLRRDRNAWTCEDDFPFKQRIAVDIGYKFPSDYPSCLAWDIETRLAGLSPNWRKDEVRSIATWNDKGESAYFTGDRRDFIPEFLAYWRKQDPDVPIDFFGRFYDYPTLIQNCNRLGIKCAMGRNGETPYILTKEFERRGRGKVENTILLRGRVAFDVQKEVDADYTLTLAGLKGRTLKEVARYYGLDPIEIDYEKMDELSEEELEAYNISDARCTYKIGQIYLRTLWELGELLDIPLDMIVHRQPSHVGNVVLGRPYNKLGIISDAPNNKRFPQFFKPYKKAIQGAEPRSFISGIFTENVKHKDFKSMYVSIMRALNLSPETLHLISIKPYTGRYRFQPEKDSCIVEMPDTLNGQVTIRIDLSKQGVMRQVLDDIVAKREVVREKWNETKDPAYWSKEIALKLVGNMLWGYNAMSYSRYGSVLVGEFCAAIPRLLIDSSIKFETEQDNEILETDTDGKYLVENNPVQFDVSTVLPDCFEIDLIKEETKSLQGMILLEDLKGEPAAKSYILKDADGKITKHGSSILGRHIPLVIDYFVDELAECLFDNKEPYDVMHSWNTKRIEDYPTKAFVSYVTVSKNPHLYHQTTMYHNLIAQLQKAGIQVDWGSKINYVKIKNGYRSTVLLRDSERIDAKYYQNRMADVASRILGKPFKTIKRYFSGDVRLTDYKSS